MVCSWNYEFVVGEQGCFKTAVSNFVAWQPSWGEGTQTPRVAGQVAHACTARLMRAAGRRAHACRHSSTAGGDACACMCPPACRLCKVSCTCANRLWPSSGLQPRRWDPCFKIYVLMEINTIFLSYLLVNKLKYGWRKLFLNYWKSQSV